MRTLIRFTPYLILATIILSFTALEAVKIAEQPAAEFEISLVKAGISYFSLTLPEGRVQPILPALAAALPYKLLGIKDETNIRPGRIAGFIAGIAFLFLVYFSSVFSITITFVAMTRLSSVQKLPSDLRSCGSPFRWLPVFSG